MAPHLSGGADTIDEGGDSSMIGQWSDEELEQLRRALREHGTNWPKVSEQIAEKTNHQCKSYYFTYRKKHGLDQVVAEYYQSLGEERRPCLTDEEESGSSTSSCDEIAVSFFFFVFFLKIFSKNQIFFPFYCKYKKKKETEKFYFETKI